MDAEMSILHTHVCTSFVCIEGVFVLWNLRSMEIVPDKLSLSLSLARALSLPLSLARALPLQFCIWQQAIET